MCVYPQLPLRSTPLAVIPFPYSLLPNEQFLNFPSTMFGGGMMSMATWPLQFDACVETDIEFGVDIPLPQANVPGSNDHLPQPRESLSQTIQARDEG